VTSISRTSKVLTMVGITRWLIGLTGILVLAGTVFAQTAPDAEQGIKPYGAYSGGDFDTVSLTNGVLDIHIPFLSYPQRGGKLKFSYTLRYTNGALGIGSVCGPNRPCIFYGEGGGGSPLLVQDQEIQPVPTLNSAGLVSYWNVDDPDGAVHNFGNVSGSVWESIDATGMRYDASSGVITDSAGTRYNPQYNFSTGISTDLIEDTNGNEISMTQSTWTDSLGRVLPPMQGVTTTDYSGCTGPLPIVAASTWTVPGLNGGSQTYKFCSATVAFDFTLTSGSSLKVQRSGSGPQLQSVVLPNGTSWILAYENTYGALATVTEPTGGSISYTWTVYQPTCTKTGTYPIPFLLEVTSRTINANDGTGGHTWNYTWGSPVKITDPLGNDSLHTITGLGGTCSLYETQAQYYQGSSSSGTLLKTVVTDYNYAPNPDSTSPISLAMNIAPIHVTTTWAANNKVSRIEKDYDSGFSFTGAHTGIYGNVVAKREYDYGTGTWGSLLRQTVTSYYALNNSSYLTYNLLKIPSSVQVKDGGGTQLAYTTYAYDGSAVSSSGISTQHSSSPGGSVRGNQTSGSSWLNTTGGYLTSSAAYFDTGTVNTATDPKGNTTTYAFSSTYAGAYPTTVTNALHQAATNVYDFNSGRLTSTTDPNSQTTTCTYDEMWRPTSVSYPDHGSISYTYNDAAPAPTVTTTKLATPDPSITSIVTFDGLGRAHQKQITSISPNILTNTTFDPLGRVSTVSNPHFSSSGPTDGATTYAYDAIGRTTQVTEQDGSIVSTTYSGNTITVTDEAGHQRKTATDGVGRLTSVWEAPSGSDYLTTYSYDALSDLTSVVQNGSRNRSFAYDSLSRLTSSTNPESGAISYTYDSDGNVLTRTDARGIITANSYDALNRVTLKSYSDGTPTVTFFYDAYFGWNVPQTNTAGRLAIAYLHTSSGLLVGQIFGYDPLGRTVMNNQCAAHACPSGGYPVTYTYDLAGDMTAFSTGAGITLSYAIDGAQRTTKMTSSYVDSQHPATLATVAPTVGFYPNGAIREVTLGNGLTETSAYNNRLQPCRMNVNSSGIALGTCTDAVPSGSVQDFNFGFNWGSADNGNVTTLVGTGQQIFNRSYVYDPLNRLSTMADSATSQTCKGLSWFYDAWGNRTAQNVTSGSCPSPQTPAGTNNRLTIAGFAYDAAGNLTHDANHSYSYDAENRLTQVDGGSTASYIYGADGRRAEKATPSGYLDYLHDLAGNVTSEWTTSSSFTGNSADYDYLNGQLVAEYIADTTYFIHKDHLGSTRLITGVTQNIVDKMDYLPFGEQIAGDTSSAHKFTGKERDAETNNDDFGARYYSPAYGRFLSADWSAIPIPVPYANLTNPQTLNLYAMVHDNPETFADLDGHEDEGASGDSGGDASGDSGGGINAVGQSQDQTTPHSPGEPIRIVTHLNTGLWSWLKSWFLGGSGGEAKSNPYVSVGTDALSLAGKATHHPILGRVASLISVANDPSVPNKVLILMSMVPGFGEGVDALVTVADVGAVAGQVATDQVIAPVFNAAPPQMIDNGNGQLIANPALMSETDVFQANH
jgi:RHS repeat-associated protein